MAVFPFTIQIESNQLFPHNMEILMNREALNSLGIFEKETVHVGFGKRATSVQIGTSSSSKSILLMSKSLADRLLIPFNCTLNVWYSQNENKLEIGPVLGILVQRSIPNSEAFFGGLTSFCEEAYDAAKVVNSFCYIVTLENIILDEGYGKGWTKVDDEWREYHFPLPHALYNRLPRGTNDKKIQKLQAIKDADTAIFNDRFLNKWQVHQILSKTNLSHLLPDTRICTKFDSLNTMLSTYQVVFLKPIHGSQGKGIMRITRTPLGFTVDRTTINGLHTTHYHSLGEVKKNLAERLKKIGFIIQQGIPLVQLGSSAIDFRVLLQKNKLGVWRVTSIVARTGNPQTFVSNLAQGGSMTSAGKTLRSLPFMSTNTPSLTDLKHTAIDIATTLEQNLTGYYGELGIDLGVDMYGRIWLIEVNSKPSKKEDTILTNVRRPRPSVIHLFDYVYFLSGFPAPVVRKQEKNNKTIFKTKKNRR